jgi:protein AATF/BFR2
MTAGRTSFSQKSNNNVRSAPALVDDALLGPAGEKLLARTRIRRGKSSRIGEMSGPGAGEEDLEGFDDTDFYQQLLREVIDARSGDGADADWVAVQKAKKAKKVVDTKASKGRRLR